MNLARIIVWPVLLISTWISLLPSEYTFLDSTRQKAQARLRIFEQSLASAQTQVQKLSHAPQTDSARRQLAQLQQHKAAASKKRNTAVTSADDTETPFAACQDMFTLSSAAFSDRGAIPIRYYQDVSHGCSGANLSIPLSWSNVPAGTQTFALVSYDSDVGFAHWGIYNIPATSTSLPEGVPALQRLPDGSRQTRNGFRTFGYGGPCPPHGSGVHHYSFVLYALRKSLSTTILEGDSADAYVLLQVLRDSDAILCAAGLTGTASR